MATPQQTPPRTPLKAALGKMPPAGPAGPTAAKPPVGAARPTPGARPAAGSARPLPGTAARPLPSAPVAAPPPPTDGEISAAGASLVAAITALVQILDEETAAVRAHDRKQMAALQERKGQTVGRYEHQMQAMRKLIAAAGGSISGPDDMKLRLKDAAGRLDKAVAKNVLALRAAKDANERLMTMIQTAAVQQRPTGQGYTAKGTVNRGYARNLPPAMSLNGTF
jgi:hypothetical protein